MSETTKNYRVHFTYLGIPYSLPHTANFKAQYLTNDNPRYSAYIVANKLNVAEMDIEISSVEEVTALEKRPVRFKKIEQLRKYINELRDRRAELYARKSEPGGASSDEVREANNITEMIDTALDEIDKLLGITRD